MKHFYRYFIGLTLMMLAIFSSCQKDQSAVKPAINADTISALDAHDGGNYLATSGTLKITIQDSTYTFDDAQDSIAFINVNINGQLYYGITAINRAHTLSFGISSYGAAEAGLSGSVAGGQLLLLNPAKGNLQYTLTTNVLPKDIGTISVDAYRQDSLLAKGQFKTYLARDNKTNSPFYKAEGTFNLIGGSH